MVELFDGWIHALGGFGFLVVALAAMLEYVVPPFPGDTVVLLGGVYAIRGQKSWALVFAAIMLGSTAGAAIDYWLGRLIAARIDRREAKGAFLGISLERIRGLQEKMRARGDWMLLANRFLPGLRGPIVVAAGASGMPFARVLALAAISAAVWNLLFFGAGLALGGNAERLERLVTTYSEVVAAVLLAIAVAFLVRLAFRRRAAGERT